MKTMKSSMRISGVVTFHLNKFGARKSLNCFNINFNSVHYISSSSDDIHNQDHYANLHPTIQILQLHNLREDYDFKRKTYYAGNKEVIQLRECPVCPRPHKNDPTNLWTLGIFMDYGSWHCFRCKNSGNWNNLIKIFNEYGHTHGCLYDDINDFKFNNFDFDDGENDDENDDEDSTIEKISRNDCISDTVIEYNNKLLLDEKPLLNRLQQERKLSIKCFQDYNVGLEYRYFDKNKQKQQCLTFPMYQYKKLNNSEHETCVATKYKTRCISNNIKQFAQYPIYNESGLFGLKNSNRCSEQVVLTEGEFDAMALYQGSNYRIKALSLPQGATAKPPDEVMKQLLNYKKIIIFMDWDDIGMESAEKLKEYIENYYSNAQPNKLRVNVQIVHKYDLNKFGKIKDANDILINCGDDGYKIIEEIAKDYDM